MKYNGYIYKSGAYWLVEIPDLGGLVTQGHSESLAFKMAKDYIDCKFEVDSKLVKDSGRMFTISY